MSLKKWIAFSCSILLMCVLVPNALFAGQYKEAPMLAELVKAGKLPPVEGRLPKNPGVEQVWDEIGVYGGDWMQVWKGLGDKWGQVAYYMEEFLLDFTPDGKSLVPNVAESVDVNENYTEFTFHLREGMKWSDGEDFDADDVLFYWEHMVVPKTFGKEIKPCHYTEVDGEKILNKVEKIDKYTFKITHAAPFPKFLEQMTIQAKQFFAPEHYYKTILPEFIGEEKALEIAKERGFPDIKNFGKWTGYYFWIYKERPTIRAWRPINDPTEQRYIFERNPYYFKVDPESNQLPYIDRIIYDLVEEDSIILKVLAGEIDCKLIDDISNYTLLMENREKGGYRISKWISADGASTCIQLNQTVEDLGLRELFQDVRFRKALSLAIDREEINEIVHEGLETPRQAALVDGLPYSSKKWSNAYAEYDPESAAKYLDEIGLPWDKEHKYRLRPDGTELVVLVDLERTGVREKVTELVKKYWEDIGLKTIVKVQDRGLFEEKRNSNKLQVGVTGFGVFDFTLRPITMLPMRQQDVWYGEYGLYNETNGEKGVKPEGDIALLLDYWNKIMAASTQEEVDLYANKIVDLHTKNIWIIGTTGMPPELYVVKSRLHNFPEGLIEVDELRGAGIANPNQFFIRE